MLIKPNPTPNAAETTTKIGSNSRPTGILRMARKIRSTNPNVIIASAATTRPTWLRLVSRRFLCQAAEYHANQHYAYTRGCKEKNRVYGLETQDFIHVARHQHRHHQYHCPTRLSDIPWTTKSVGR